MIQALIAVLLVVLANPAGVLAEQARFGDCANCARAAVAARSARTFRPRECNSICRKARNPLSPKWETFVARPRQLGQPTPRISGFGHRSGAGSLVCRCVLPGTTQSGRNKRPAHDQGGIVRGRRRSTDRLRSGSRSAVTRRKRLLESFWPVYLWPRCAKAAAA